MVGGISSARRDESRGSEAVSRPRTSASCPRACERLRSASGRVPEKEEPPTEQDVPKAVPLCSWWRRGSVELPVQKAPWADILQTYSAICSRFSKLPPTESPRSQPINLSSTISASREPHPERMAPASQPSGITGSRRSHALGG